MLSGLIGSIYDCALEPDRWERTLAAIVEALECKKAILSLNDLRYDRAVISRSVGWDSHWLDERAKHLPEIHARLNEWFAQRPSLDEPFVASRNLHRGYVENSAYVQQCLSPQHLIDIAHFILIREPTHFAELALARHERQNVLSQREIELGALLLPHLRRAVTISNVLDTRTIESARMIEALDALRCCVILTNEHAAVLHLNRSAEQMLQKDGPIKCIRGVLQAKH